MITILIYNTKRHELKKCNLTHGAILLRNHHDFESALKKSAKTGKEDEWSVCVLCGTD